MMDFLNLIPETVFLMANIFAGMGVEGNSGKLTFRKICAGTNISITEDAKGITFSAIGSGSGSADANEIVYGTGTGITSSNFCVSQGANKSGLFGFSGIRSGTQSNYRSYVNGGSGNSLVIGGMGNNICQSKRSTVIGSINATIYLSDDSSIISSCNGSYLSISGSTSSSIISSAQSNIGNASLSTHISSLNANSKISNYSSIISSRRIKDFGATNTGKSTSMFTSISSECSCFYSANSLIYYPDSTKNNTIISSYASCFFIQKQKNGLLNNTILSSDCSSIIGTIITRKSGNDYSTPTNSTVISSCSSCLYGDYSSIISSNYSKLIGGTTPKAISIIASKGSSYYKVRVCDTSYSSVISSKYSTIGYDFREKHLMVIGTCYSYSYSGRGSILGGSSNKILDGSISSTIIGGSSNQINYGKDYSIILGGAKNSTKFYSKYGNKGNEGIQKFVTIGGKTPKNDFLIIGGYNNCGYGFSIIIGGHYNVSAKTSQTNYNDSNRREYRVSPASGIIVGGLGNCTSSSSGTLVTGNNNWILNTIDTAIIGGEYNTILAIGCYSEKLYAYNPLTNTVCNSFILGGCNNCFTNLPNCMTWNSCGPYRIYQSGIIGGYNNKICGITIPKTYSAPLKSSVIVGGSSIINCRSCTLSVESLLVGSSIKANNGTALCTGFSGTVANPTSICVVNGLVISVS
jgi:hypothetical protein